MDLWFDELEHGVDLPIFGNGHIELPSRYQPVTELSITSKKFKKSLC